MFILPSLSEGMPHTVLEAIACRKPVVATNVGGIPNLIKNYLVAPADSNDLANKIQLALNNSKLEKLPKEFLLDNVIDQIKINLHVP